MAVFGYTITKRDDQSQLPFEPVVCIRVTEYGIPRPGEAPMLVNGLMSDAEIDWHVNALKADLDRAAKCAKAALHAARKLNDVP